MKHKDPVWIVFWVWGMGSLFGWNALITAYDYLSLHYGSNIEFVMSLAFQLPNVITLFLMIKISHLLSFRGWIFASYGSGLLALVLIPLTPVVLTSPGTQRAVFLTLVVWIGAATAVAFSSCMSAASQLNKMYVGAMMSGNGIGSVIVVMIRILTKALPFTPTASAIVYFVCAGISQLICLGALHVYQTHQRTDTISAAASPESGQLLDQDPEDELDPESHSTNPMDVLKRILPMAFSVTFVFFISLSLFPGVTSRWKPTNMNAHDGWFTVILFALFMVFDFTGRTLPQWFLVVEEKGVVIAALLRVSFLVLFMFGVHPRLFHSDVLAFFIMMFFAVTNGYFSTLSMMYAPRNVSGKAKEVAGQWMAAFINVGIIFGVSFALVLCRIISGGWSPCFDG